MVVPTLKLEHIIHEPAFASCHIFGLFLYHDTFHTTNYWILIDETNSRGVKIKLAGDLSNYPKPKPGDVIRIHRLLLDKATKMPYIVHPRNVIVWTSFKKEPTVITVANSPTIGDEDNVRRAELERFFISTITPIARLSNPGILPTNHFNVAGRVEKISKDDYSNIILRINDGYNEIDLRVFPKRNDIEDGSHYESASKLQIGDLILVTNVKLLPRILLDLSANLKSGKWLRVVENESNLGRELNEKLKPLMDAEQNGSKKVKAVERTIEPNNNSSQEPRRSKRLQSMKTSSSQSSGASSSLGSPSPKKVPIIDTSSKIVNSNIPIYTKIASLKPDNYSHYYDIAGQVRGLPQEAPSFKNWLIQLYDGSTPCPQSYWTDLLKEPQENCVSILVYSKQKETDTSQHVDKVMRLKEGDFIYIKNIKSSWNEGKLRLELSANLLHGKSIEVIDKDTPFGIHLIEQCTFPQVEELTEEPSQDSIDNITNTPQI